jgi:hypothetical protein
MNISGLSMIDAWLALTTHDNLYAMTNGEYRQDFIEGLAKELDPARVLYGSVEATLSRFCAPTFERHNGHLPHQALEMQPPPRGIPDALR